MQPDQSRVIDSLPMDFQDRNAYLSQAREIQEIQSMVNRYHRNPERFERDYSRAGAWSLQQRAAEYGIDMRLESNEGEFLANLLNSFAFGLPAMLDRDIREKVKYSGRTGRAGDVLGSIASFAIPIAGPGNWLVKGASKGIKAAQTSRVLGALGKTKVTQKAAAKALRNFAKDPAKKVSTRLAREVADGLPAQGEGLLGSMARVRRAFSSKAASEGVEQVAKSVPKTMLEELGATGRALTQAEAKAVMQRLAERVSGGGIANAINRAGSLGLAVGAHRGIIEGQRAYGMQLGGFADRGLAGAEAGLQAALPAGVSAAGGSVLAGAALPIRLGAAGVVGGTAMANGDPLNAAMAIGMLAPGPGRAARAATRAPKIVNESTVTNPLSNLINEARDVRRAVRTATPPDRLSEVTSPVKAFISRAGARTVNGAEAVSPATPLAVNPNDSAVYRLSQVLRTRPKAPTAADRKYTEAVLRNIRGAKHDGENNLKTVIDMLISSGMKRQDVGSALRQAAEWSRETKMPMADFLMKTYLS